MQVPARSSSRTTQAKGIYPGAKVMRGPDWAARYKDQDGKIMMNVNVLRQYEPRYLLAIGQSLLLAVNSTYTFTVDVNKIKKT